MTHADEATPGTCAAGVGGSAEQLWQTRLLAFDALVELARQRAVEPDGSGCEQTRRLADALESLQDAISLPSPADAATVAAAVAALGDTLATMDRAPGQQP